MPKKMTTSDMEADNEFRLGRLVGEARADRDPAVTPEALEGIIWKLEEIKVAVREGAFRGGPSAGSPAYVRCLRDQAVMDAYMREVGGVATGQLHLLDKWKAHCVEAADGIIRALGYDPPGEPGKEG